MDKRPPGGDWEKQARAWYELLEGSEAEPSLEYLSTKKEESIPDTTKGEKVKEEGKEEVSEGQITQDCVD